MNIKSKELMAILIIYRQKKLKDDALGYSKYMGDGIWKIKIKADANLEEQVDTLYHEVSEMFFDTFRPDNRTENCANEDHLACIEIADKASKIFLKRLKHGDIRKRYGEEK